MSKLSIILFFPLMNRSNTNFLDFDGVTREACIAIQNMKYQQVKIAKLSKVFNFVMINYVLF